MERFVMTEEERKEAIESLKEICREIGCSGLSPDLCQKTPQQCYIIRKLVMPQRRDDAVDEKAEG